MKMRSLGLVALIACAASGVALGQEVDANLPVDTIGAGSVFVVKKDFYIEGGHSGVLFIDGEPVHSFKVDSFCTLWLKDETNKNGRVLIKAGTKLKVSKLVGSYSVPRNIDVIVNEFSKDKKDLISKSGWFFEEGSPIERMTCNEGAGMAKAKSKFKIKNLLYQFGDFITAEKIVLNSTGSEAVSPAVSDSSVKATPVGTSQPVKNGESGQKMK